MKTTSLWQPWASFIAWGFKLIETRDYYPPRSVIGQRIAIHAAKRPMRPEEYQDCTTAMNEIGAAELLDGDGFPLGAVVATAVLRCAHRVRWEHEGLAWLELAPGDCPHYQAFGEGKKYAWTAPIDPYGNFNDGRVLWFLEDVERLNPPVPARGMQGFWEWTQE